jgi:uncharacterized protein YggE
MADTNLIEVVELHHEDVKATGADLSITLADAKYFRGIAALTQAGEVRKLVEALVANRIAEADIGIESVHAQTSKGVLLKSSSATYTIGVRCREPNQVAAVLDAVTGLKNTFVQAPRWRYDVPDATRNRWLATCLLRAKGAAEAMAQALGMKISSVHRVVDETYAPAAPQSPVHYADGAAPMARARTSSVESVFEGMDLAPTEERVTRVRAWFAMA